MSGPAEPPDRLEVLPVDGVAEVTEGTDVAALVGDVSGLTDGDVVLLTSKLVSKAEGRVLRGGRDAAIAAETVRLVARRGPTSIVENHLGLVMAAAGVDASNVPPGLVALLPHDPDATARRVREQVHARTGRNVAVLVTDTAGRAWRHGQTDIAIGAAGLDPLHDYAGQRDRHGNPLAVTAPAVGDELAGAAELVAGKLGGRPLVVVRGLAGLVRAPGDHGPGARVLVRGRAEDMFGLGSREAVVAAVRGSDATAFGTPAAPEELIALLSSFGWPAVADGDEVLVQPRGEDASCAVDVPLALARVVAFAHGWQSAPDMADHSDSGSPERLRLRRRPS